MSNDTLIVFVIFQCSLVIFTLTEVYIYCYYSWMQISILSNHTVQLGRGWSWGCSSQAQGPAAPSSLFLTAGKNLSRVPASTEAPAGVSKSTPKKRRYKPQGRAQGEKGEEKRQTHLLLKMRHTHLLIFS